MSNTEKNLTAAFAGESQANRKYLAFAKQADAEGHAQVAKLFRAAAEAETIHAHAHLKVLGVVKSTAENLKAAIEGETHEFEKMYPAFIQEAEADKNTAAIRTFKFANDAEKIHAELYQKYLDNLSKNETTDIHMCVVCGYLAEGSTPDNCPICGAKAQAFKKMD